MEESQGIRKANIEYKKGNLFECFLEKNQKIIVAHCISKDLEMDKGIAKKFKDLFGRKGLTKQEPEVGYSVYQKYSEIYICHLVTKLRYFHRPSYENLESSLRSLYDFSLKLGYKELRIPKIGCGLDRLNWKCVEELLKDIFIEFNIIVYEL